MRFFSKSQRTMLTLGILGDDAAVLDDLIEAIKIGIYWIEEQQTPEWVEVSGPRG